MTDTENIRVEIVVPVHNRKEITLQCLKSLADINRTGLEVHVIVVDDGSTDGTDKAIGEQFPDVEVIRGDGTLYYTKGTNAGLAAAMNRAPHYILGINDDSIFHNEFLTRMVDCARRNPRTIVGALLLLWDDPHRVFQVGAKWDTWYGGWRHPMNLTAFNVPRSAWEVELIVGNCVLYPLDAVREVGLMNERAFPYGFGDAEYTPRMRKRGWYLMIEPSAYVWCQPNTLPPSIKHVSWQLAIGEVFFDMRSQRNLIRLFLGRWHAAPSRWLGFAAFVIHVVRMVLHAFGIGGSWPRWPDPGLKGVTTKVAL
jgi:GT2 family glycosyltransferase